MGMDVTMIADGLWQWSASVEGRARWSTYVEAPDATVLIDPGLPEEDAERDRFWRAFDADVERRGLPVRVLVTGEPDDPMLQALRDRHGADVHGPSADRARGIAPIADETSPIGGIVCRHLTAPTGERRGIYLLHDHAAVVIGEFPDVPEHRRTLVTHVIDSTNMRAEKTGETPTTFRWLLSAIAPAEDLSQTD